MKTNNLKSLVVIACAVAFIAITTGCATAKEKPITVAFPAGIHHEAWDALVKKYVNEKGLVAYAKWKANAADQKALADYLAQFGAKPEPAAKGDELAASGINAYNAFAIHTILENYPVESIHKISGVFENRAHLIGGKKVALNDIEHGTMRPLLGYRAHAALVCCARSCPPLRRFAYTAAGLDGQIEVAYTNWLAREDLNKYEPDKNQVEISSIFKWFKEDFEAAGGVPKILGMYGPLAQRPFLAKGGYKIENLPYHWGLNDQSALGKDYSKSDLIFDHIFK